MELQQIIDSVHEGDTQAFAQLVSRYRDMAFGYALTLLDQEQAAEDAVQEALVIAYTHLDRLEQPQAFGAWLRGIVRHQCYRARRAAPDNLGWEHLQDIGGGEADLAQTVAGQVMRNQVRAAIAALTPAQQDVLGLHYEAGLSHQEIATRLNLTVSTVNMRLHAARTRLRRRLRIMNDPTTQPHHSGRVQDADGPIVIVQFAPNATPPIFSHLLSEGKENVCVVQHLSAGRVRAIATRPDAIWTPGQEVFATGEPFTQSLDLATVRQLIQTLRPASSGVTALESGIKTIEVFAPLTQGGVTGIFTEWGLGVLVLLPELIQRLDQEDNRQTFFVLMPSIRDMTHWQEIIPELTVGTRNLQIVYLPVLDPILPAFISAVQDLDTTLVLTRRLAEQAIWPCLDPLACHSRRLNHVDARPDQDTLACDLRQLLRRYYTLQFSLGDEARHALSQEEEQTIQRARKTIRFLSQPFFVAEPYTGKPGVFVTSEDAIQGFAGILAGRYDILSKETFYMVGAAPIAE